jgi:hypothetical protein
LIIDKANGAITESLIKELHRILKSGTSDSRISWFAVGDYKKVPNEVGGKDTTPPENVAEEMKKLLATLEKENKGLRYRIFGAIQRGGIDGFKEISKMQGLKAYADDCEEN